MHIPEEKQTIEEQKSHDHLSPPSYSQACPPPTSTSTSTTLTTTRSQSRSQYQSPSETILSRLLSTFVTSPTNHVHVSEQNGSVKGSWTIDTALSPPPAFLAPVKKEKSKRKNLYVYSQNGCLNVKIRLIGLPEVVREQATFHCESQNGSVQVYILPRPHQPFHLKAHTDNGSVTVYLPRDFTGPIEHLTKNGSTVFSPEIRPFLTTFSSTKGEGRSFIGDWQGSLLGGEEGSSSFISTSDWPGDHLVISSINGSLHIQYIDEDTGFLKTIKGWFNRNAETRE